MKISYLVFVLVVILAQVGISKTALAGISEVEADVKNVGLEIGLEANLDQDKNSNDESTLKEEIMALGQKVGNHALILFTTKHTDTIIDTLKDILAKKGVNNSDPSSLEKFISQNQIDKNKFFAEVEAAKNYLAESQVKLFTSWEAYLRQSWVKARHDYDDAKAAWDKFDPLAAKINQEIDSWASLNSGLINQIDELRGNLSNSALIISNNSHPETEKAKNHLILSEVSILKAENAYNVNNMIEADASYKKALSEWNLFEALAKKIDAETKTSKVEATAKTKTEIEAKPVEPVTTDIALKAEVKIQDKAETSNQNKPSANSKMAEAAKNLLQKFEFIAKVEAPSESKEEKSAAIKKIDSVLQEQEKVSENVKDKDGEIEVLATAETDLSAKANIKAAGQESEKSILKTIFVKILFFFKNIF